MKDADLKAVLTQARRDTERHERLARAGADVVRLAEAADLAARALKEALAQLGAAQERYQALESHTGDEGNAFVALVEEVEAEKISERAGDVTDAAVRTSPDPEASSRASAELQAAEPSNPATKLSSLDELPDVVADLLFTTCSSAVETLLEHVEAEQQVDLPLRNKLFAFFLDRKVKRAVAARAADVIADHVADVTPTEPEPAPTASDRSFSIADTGIALVIRTDGSTALVKKLTQSAGVKTIGELCEWVDREFPGDGGMSDTMGPFAAFRSLGASARTAGLATDAVVSFLKTHGLDKRSAPQPEALVQKVVAETAIRFDAIPGMPAAGISALAATGVHTVEDLDAMVAALRKKRSFGAATRYTALRELGIDQQLVLAVGDKLVDHFAPQVPKQASAKPKKSVAPKRKRKGAAA